MEVEVAPEPEPKPQQEPEPDPVVEPEPEPEAEGMWHEGGIGSSFPRHPMRSSSYSQLVRPN